MNDRDREAMAAICLMAAGADGERTASEREQLQQVFDSLGVEGTPSVYQRVILGSTDLPTEARALSAPQVRTLAYELAVCVCDADGAVSPAEREFLDALRAELDVPSSFVDRIEKQAESLALVPVSQAEPGSEATAAPPSPTSEIDEREIEDSILKTSILTAGLELLPQSMATLAIIPLQMRMVYRLGTRFGYTLDRGHLREFLATAGLGLTSQVVDNLARKFLGGIIRKVAGGLAGGLTGTAAGAAVTFATTWSLGQAARTYYAGGRQLTPEQLRSLFQENLERGRELFTRHEGDIRSRSRAVDIPNLISEVREH